MPRPAALYDDDIYAWAQHQADALRRLARARADLPNDLDLENVAEEIEDVGKSELHATTSLLSQVLIHLVKAHADPSSIAAKHWLAEAQAFQAQARRRFSPGMHRLIDLDDLWSGSVRIATSKLLAYGVESFPSPSAVCPFTLDELLAPDFDSHAALPRLRVLGGRTPS